MEPADDPPATRSTKTSRRRKRKAEEVTSSLSGPLQLTIQIAQEVEAGGGDSVGPSGWPGVSTRRDDGKRQRHSRFTVGAHTLFRAIRAHAHTETPVLRAGC